MFEKGHWQNIAKQAGLEGALKEIFVTRMLTENMDKTTQEIKGSYEARTVDRYLSDIYSHFRDQEYDLPENGKKLWKALREELLAKYPIQHPWETLWANAQDTARLTPRLVTTTMDLGMVEESFPVMSKVAIWLEVQEFPHLVMLEKGASGTLYCLAPSYDAAATHFQPGATILPSGSKRRAYTLGRVGTEQVLAVLSAKPLPLSWLPSLESQPLVLNAEHLQELAVCLPQHPHELLRRQFMVTQS